MSWSSAPNTRPLRRRRLETGAHAELVREAGESLAVHLRGRVLRLDGVRERGDHAMRADHLGGDSGEAQHAPDAGHQLGLVVGLSDEVVGAGIEAGDDVVRGYLAGDEDDRQGDGPRIGTQAPADVETVQPGHPDVEEDEVGRSRRPRRAGRRGRWRPLIERNPPRSSSRPSRARLAASSSATSTSSRSRPEGHRRPPHHAGKSPSPEISPRGRARATVRRSVWVETVERSGTRFRRSVRPDLKALGRQGSMRAEPVTRATGVKPRGVVEMRGLEPLTPAMRTRCSSS